MTCPHPFSGQILFSHPYLTNDHSPCKSTRFTHVIALGNITTELRVGEPACNPSKTRFVCQITTICQRTGSDATLVEALQ